VKKGKNPYLNRGGRGGIREKKKRGRKSRMKNHDTIVKEWKEMTRLIWEGKNAEMPDGETDVGREGLKLTLSSTNSHPLLLGLKIVGRAPTDHLRF